MIYRNVPVSQLSVKFDPNLACHLNSPIPAAQLTRRVAGNLFAGSQSLLRGPHGHPPSSGCGRRSGTARHRPLPGPRAEPGAVGATQYVQWVNSSFAVFDKATGAVLYGPAAGNSLWSRRLSPNRGIHFRNSAICCSTAIYVNRRKSATAATSAWILWARREAWNTCSALGSLMKKNHQLLSAVLVAWPSRMVA